MNALSNQKVTITEQFKITEREVTENLANIEQCDRNIGKSLKELKNAITEGKTNPQQIGPKLEVFYEWVESKFKFNKDKTKRYINMYEAFGTEPTSMTKTHMNKIVSMQPDKREILVQAIEEIAEEEPTLKVPMEVVNAGKAMLKEHEEARIEQIKGAMQEKIKEHQQRKDEAKQISANNYGESFAHNLIRTARLCWNADMSAQELCDAIEKIKDKDTIPHQENLQLKLNKIWSIMNIGEEHG